MPIMESMSQNEFEEIRDSIKKWLETEQNRALYWDEMSPSETIEVLLSDLESSSVKNFLPWEDD